MNGDLAPIQAKTCVVRDTGAKRGRHISVAPGTTAARHLHFGRIVLGEGDAPVANSIEASDASSTMRPKCRCRAAVVAGVTEMFLPRRAPVSRTTQVFA